MDSKEAMRKACKNVGVQEVPNCLSLSTPVTKTASSKKLDSNGIPVASFGGKPLD